MAHFQVSDILGRGKNLPPPLPHGRSVGLEPMGDRVKEVGGAPPPCVPHLIKLSFQPENEPQYEVC